MDAKIPSGNDSERGYGGGDNGGGRGGGRWDDDDDDDNFFGPRKEQLSCGRRGKNRGRGGSAGNAFYSRDRGMGPSIENPAPAFFMLMFRATDIRPDDAEFSRKWDDGLSMST
jgi:hypothetical protein